MANKALLIGINDYASIFPLKGCCNDVVNVQEILVSKFGFSENNISILPNNEAVKKNIKAKWDWLTQDHRPNDICVFYFSGHGFYIRDVHGEESDNFDELIALYDMDLSFKNPDGYLLDDEFTKWIEGAPKELKLVFIFDSCYSGTVIDLGHSDSGIGPRPSGTGTRAIGPEHPNAQLKGIDHPDTLNRTSQGSKHRKLSRSLKSRDKPHPDHILLAGCGEGQRSAFIDGMDNSAFTYYLCKNIRDKGNDQTYVELIANVKQSLEEGDFKQVPQCEGDNINKKIFT